MGDNDDKDDDNDDRLTREDRIDRGHRGPLAPQGRTAMAFPRRGFDAVIQNTKQKK